VFFSVLNARGSEGGSNDAEGERMLDIEGPEEGRRSVSVKFSLSVVARVSGTCPLHQHEL
jgi:hypothetical protein